MIDKTKGKLRPVDAAYADRQRLEGLLERGRKAQTEAAEIRGAVGGEVSTYLEDTGHNKVALGIVSRLHRMTEEKRRDVLASLAKLMPLAMVIWGENETPDMFADEGDEDGDAPALASADA